MAEWLKKNPWVARIARDVLIALLVSALAVLGYDASRIVPREQQIAQGQVGARAFPGSDTNLYSLTTEDDIDAGADVTAATYVKAGTYVESTTYALAGTFIRGAGERINITTDGATITPTKTMVYLMPTTSTRQITVSVSGFVTGTLLTLVNLENITVGISDTTGTRMAGNFDMGQYDAINYWFDGSSWIELNRSNN